MLHADVCKIVGCNVIVHMCMYTSVVVSVSAF